MVSVSLFIWKGQGACESFGFTAQQWERLGQTAGVQILTLPLKIRECLGLALSIPEPRLSTGNDHHELTAARMRWHNGDLIVRLK